MPFQILICRVEHCILLIEDSSQNQCQHFLKYDLIKNIRNRQKQIKDSIPAKLKAVICNTNLNEIKLSMQQKRFKCKQPEKKIQFMQTEL